MSSKDATKTTPSSFLAEIHAHVGFIGLGAMGLPMALNVQKQLSDKHYLYVYDVNPTSVQQAVAQGAIACQSPAEMADHVDVVISMVPNDEVLKRVVSDPETGILSSSSSSSSKSNSKASRKSIIHIGCSTVHPETSRAMARLHQEYDGNSYYIGAPVFARADGVAQRAASLVVGGDDTAIANVQPVLESMAQGIYYFGDSDAGAGNVVKLCGNFMIASAIESCAEACSLAEHNGADRVAVMEMLTSTIFDCLIYKGYGMRVAHRQHVPGQPMVGPGFRLDLGLKDVTLAKDVAQRSKSPMPLASLLQDRFLASQAKGRSAMDWSALALLSSEDAGMDVSPWLPGGKEAAEKGDSIAPM